VKLVRKRAPSVGVGSSRRKDLSKNDRSPGPGAYNLRYAESRGPKWLFTTTDRTERTLNTEPGPGAYNIASKFADVPSYAYGGYPLKIHL